MTRPTQTPQPTEQAFAADNAVLASPHRNTIGEHGRRLRAHLIDGATGLPTLLAENKWLRTALNKIIAASVIEGEVEDMKYVQASCYHDMLKIARAALAENTEAVAETRDTPFNPNLNPNIISTDAEDRRDWST